MNILLAPDSFKGSLTSVQVAETMRGAILKEMPSANVTIFPLADGGEGSLEAFQACQHGQWVNVEVQGPLGRPRSTKYLRQGSRAIIELAQAAGLTLIDPGLRDPGITSTYGTGEQIRHALAAGATEIVLCIGGSATNDAGMGIAAALGFVFKDISGQAFVPTGNTLHKIHVIEDTAVTRPPEFKVLCDVTNPFVGPTGAVHIYARQKGACIENLAFLESNMVSLADRLAELELPHIHTLPGAGAAGGVGGGLHALLGADLESGIDFILDLGMRQAIREADMVITGEGLLDKQTLHGKAIAGISRAAAEVGVPVVAVCGALELDGDEVVELGLKAAWSIQTRCQSFTEARERSRDDLKFVTRQLMRTFSL